MEAINLYIIGNRKIHLNTLVKSVKPIELPQRNLAMQCIIYQGNSCIAECTSIDHR